MSKPTNFFQRTLNAIVEGRAREAERYVARLNLDHFGERAKAKQR